MWWTNTADIREYETHTLVLVRQRLYHKRVTAHYAGVPSVPDSTGPPFQISPQLCCCEKKHILFKLELGHHLAMALANATCPLESAFQTVNSSYNWTLANEKYSQYNIDADKQDDLEVLLLVNANPGVDWGYTPGCYFLGTLDEKKVKQCEELGGMAIVNSRTKRVVDADVWFCGLPGNGYERRGPQPNSTMVDRLASRISDSVITVPVPHRLQQPIVPHGPGYPWLSSPSRPR